MRQLAGQGSSCSGESRLAHDMLLAELTAIWLCKASAIAVVQRCWQMRPTPPGADDPLMHITT
jgi:hypothetical protein